MAAAAGAAEDPAVGAAEEAGTELCCGDGSAAYLAEVCAAYESPVSCAEAVRE